MYYVCEAYSVSLSSLIPSLIAFSILFQSPNPIATPGSVIKKPQHLWTHDFLFLYFFSCGYFYSIDFPSLLGILFYSFSLSVLHLLAPFPSLSRKDSMLSNVSLWQRGPSSIAPDKTWISLFALAIPLPGLLDTAGKNRMVTQTGLPEVEAQQPQVGLSSACLPTTFPWPACSFFLSHQSSYFKNSTLFPNLQACLLYSSL